MKIPAKWFTEPITVRTFAGSGAYGKVLNGPLEVTGDVSMKRVLTRNAQGVEQTGEMTLRLPPTTEHGDPRDLFTPESKVTAAGRDGTVITCKPLTLRGRVVYVEVTTT